MCSPSGCATIRWTGNFERFDTMALPELARLFRGKTGIVDHC